MAGIFGTDGVRGRANTYPMTAETALRLARSAGRRLTASGERARVVIGKDTRLSCYMIESALVSGFVSMGVDVLQTGPLPTPAVGKMTRSLRADMGIMITASHNPFEDNGVKFFGADGYKLSDAEEAAIEAGLDDDGDAAAPAMLGRAQRVEGATERYVEFAKRAFPCGLRLDGLKVVIDAANGAAFRTAPDVIWELGAEVVRIGVSPDGTNINRGCGSTQPEACRAAVLEHGADLGITLDGDGDRVHLIDENGQLTDGDQLMALIATRAAKAGGLERGTLVTTVMSNMGLERHLAEHGILMERTAVGDRHVVERMRELGCNIGGEQSGHIVLADHTTTGDGLIAGLQALAAIVETGERASEVLHRFEPMPQVLHNVAVARGARPLDGASARRAIDDAGRRLGDKGRVLVRASGTEPMVRVMIEGEDAGLIETMACEIAAVLAHAGDGGALNGARAFPAPPPHRPVGAEPFATAHARQS